MMSQLRQVGVQVLRVELLQRLAEPSVQQGAPRRRQLVVERVAYESVREAQAPRRPGRVADQTGLGRLIKRREELRLGLVRQALQRGDVEFASDHRGEGKGAPAALGHE